MKKVLKITLSLLSLLLVLFCNGQSWTYENSGAGIKITYEFELTVTGSDSSLTMKLSILDQQANRTFDYGSIELDQSNFLDSIKLGDLLKTKYHSIWQANGKSNINKHSNYLSEMVLAVKDTISLRNQKSLVYQGLYMFRSLLKGAQRDVNNSGSVNFTVMGGYIVAISSFVCEEDEYMNIQEFKTYLENRKLWDTKNAGIDYYLDALKNETATQLNMVEMTGRLQTYFEINFGGWPQGGECGCCGNYR